MSSSQIQKLIDEKNLDLQQISEQTGLPVESIESFEKRTQTVFAELEKISNALDMLPSEMLGISLEKTFSGRRPPLWFCEAFPDAPSCQKESL